MFHSLRSSLGFLWAQSPQFDQCCRSLQCFLKGRCFQENPSLQCFQCNPWGRFHLYFQSPQMGQ